MVDRDPECVFCTSMGGRVVYEDGLARVVLTDEPFAGFCRVIWKAHVRELTDLAPGERTHLMSLVFAVETALRDLLRPHKMNVASLGNQTPHVHWHVMPRFADDSHFPHPIWAARQRDAAPRPLPPGFEAALTTRVAALVACPG
jgi:diadenosine tetraphosphate (Ap4A) HIT family hydrolase